MEELKNRYTEYAFSGDRGIPVSITTVLDVGRIGPNEENVVEIRGAAGGAYISDDIQNLPSSIYIDGTENYDGLRNLFFVRAGRENQVYAEYVAESFVGATHRVGFKATVPSEFGGFRVHVPAVSGVSSDLEIINYSARGSAFNNLLYTKDMIDVTDIDYWFSPPRFLAPGDRLDLTWADSNRENWGISLYIRELS